MRIFTLYTPVFFTAIFSVISVFSLLSAHSVSAESRLFKVSAYYSPVLGQDKYVSSYSADIAMNGNGTHGADGTAVYVGMISAPYTYEYGTKISLEGLGVGTVHDRGGAIYAAKGYDRLDIWMGTGDEGRIRALNWGMRMVQGEIVSNSTPEGFLLEWGGPSNLSNISNSGSVRSVTSVSSEYFNVNLSIDGYSKKKDVEKMQKFLQSQGFFDVNLYGYFGPITEKSVIDFQLDKGIVSSQYEYGAGVWGPKTQKVANNIYKQSIEKKTEEAAEAEEKTEEPVEELKTIETQNESMGGIEKSFIDGEKKIAVTVISSVQNKNYTFTRSLWRGNKNQTQADVKNMQQFLSDINMYRGTVSGRYSQATRSAVFDFQVSEKILTSWKEAGAGEWGPKTRVAAEGYGE